MKKKVFSLILGGVFCLSALAQPTITNAEDFTVGTVLKFQDCVTAGVNSGNAGANQTWNFTNLQSLTDTITEWMVLPSSTTNGGLFPSSNIVEKYSDGRFVYIDKTSQNNLLVGFVDTVNAITMYYPNAMRFAVRPMTFGTLVTDTFTENYTSGSYNFSGSGTINIDADGYGTLMLPNGTYSNALRVKITQFQTDTLLQFSSLVTTTTVSYVWFDGMHTSALLKIDSTHSGSFNSKSVEYLLSETTATPELFSIPNFSCFPNPASEQIVFTCDEPGTVEIIDLTGKIVETFPITGTRSPFSIEQLPPSLYTIIFTSDHYRAVSQLIVLH